ncbi:MAG TPA: fructose-6-phosphate aldolase [Rhodopila sp.]|uniref:fructose-6-phosphate aldolase n=1 Tax=Rhodopila sp. TaxID=2480087 RepID=UPI002C58862B|nr:fructose-6-phosphate aldolase [Rhodopila sp.]HVY16891.1 fructose-6-phosphate aldolase [Rhodopila sp.]
MKFFVDTADLGDIRSLVSSGLLDGVTTNPSLVAKSGKDFKEVIKDICAVVPGPVSAEVAGTEYDQIMAEANVLRKIADNVCIKVPLTPDGLRACRHLREDGTMVNVTLCFSPAQALLAAKSKASFVSPFVGRVDDIGWEGMGLIADIVQIYDNYDFETEILVASVRSPMHVVEAAKLGAHVATLPPAVLRSLFNHPLTEKGLATFLADWAKTGQTIV